MFFGILKIFLVFVQTQFYYKLKVFQRDGGTEFVNYEVNKLLLENGTHHKYLVPTPRNRMVMLRESITI